MSIGFVPSIRERCLYTKIEGNFRTILVVNVDDILVLTPKKVECDYIVKIHNETPRTFDPFPGSRNQLYVCTCNIYLSENICRGNA